MLFVQVGKKAGERVTAEGIEVALNPEELDLDTAAMQAKYEQTVREQQSQLEKEDLSDMVAEHAAKQQKVVAAFLHENAAPVFMISLHRMLEFSAQIFMSMRSRCRQLCFIWFVELIIFELLKIF